MYQCNRAGFPEKSLVLSYGSNFVQELDRPFRLYQLSKFSVRASVNQASSRMGQISIGLFDQDMKCVFSILLGDSWLSETRGYVYATYYSESGGSYSQGLVDIYSSFDKTAAVWYDRCSSSIRSAIDGSMVTLAPAYNTSRIVSYLVIGTHRYADASLLDMRVHDIDIAANIRATLPWLPEPPPSEEPLPVASDGTLQGGADALARSRADIAAQEARGQLQLYWTGPWPELHFVRQLVERPDDTSFHVKRDLLGKVTVSALEAGSYSEPGLQDVWFDEVFLEWLLLEGAVCGTIWIAIFNADLYETTGYVNLAAIATALAMNVLSIVLAFLILDWCYDNGYGKDWVSAMYFLLAIEMLSWAWGSLILDLFVGMVGGALFQIVRQTMFLRVCCDLSLFWISEFMLTMAAVISFGMSYSYYLASR